MKNQRKVTKCWIFSLEIRIMQAIFLFLYWIQYLLSYVNFCLVCHKKVPFFLSDGEFYLVFRYIWFIYMFFLMKFCSFLNFLPGHTKGA